MRPVYNWNVLPKNLVEYGIHFMICKNSLGVPYTAAFKVFVSNRMLGRTLTEYEAVTFYLHDPNNILAKDFENFKRAGAWSRKIFNYKQYWVLSDSEKLKVKRL